MPGWDWVKTESKRVADLGRNSEANGFEQKISFKMPFNFHVISLRDPEDLCTCHIHTEGTVSYWWHL